MAKENKKLKEKIRGYSNAMNAMEYEAALDQYYTNKRNDETVADLKDQSARDQWSENEKIRQLKVLNATDQYDKSQKLYETTLDAIDLAARDAEERVRLGLDEQIAEFAFQYDDLERDMYKAAAQAGLQYDQKQQSLESARITDMTTQENIKLERKYKRKQYKEQLRQNNRDKKSNRADSQKAMFEETLKRIQATGAARARGQLGNSTKRAVSTAQALSGINQQQLEDNLYFSQSKLQSQRNTIKAEQKFTLGSKSDKATGFANLSIKAAARRGGSLGLKAAESRKQSKTTKKGIKREQEYISEQLGITQEEFEMSREKLAESLSSAAAQSELKLKNIKTKEFEAQGQAYAAKMVKPRFGDAAPIPYKTPKTQFVLPKPAPKTPMMQGSMGRAASRPASGGSIALGIGSAALAIGAGFATGGTATALMGASGVLGGISSLFQ